MHKTVTSSSEIQLYVKPNCSKSKKALAYAKSISSRVNTIELVRTNNTGTVWRNILAKLDKSSKELMDKSLPYYQANVKGREFEDRDWTNLLMKNLDLLRSPIAVRGDKAIILDNPTDIYKL